MPKNSYAYAVLAILLIPVVVILGGLLHSAIDPEWALRTGNYSRNFQLISMAKQALLLATFMATVGLGCLACFLIVWAKQQSWWWLLLAALGPFGLMALSSLRDRAPAADDWHAAFINRLKWFQRIPYEAAVFVAVCFIAGSVIDLKRDLMIWLQSIRTGAPEADIIREQMASSGMHAFSEGLEMMFLAAFLYLIRPILLNQVQRWFFRRGDAISASEKSSAGR